LPSLFRKKDIAIIAALIAAAVLFYAVPKLLTPSGRTASVIYDGEQLMSISLSEDAVYTVQGDLTATLEVKDGRIRFIHSLCPDKLCEGFGWISLEGETAVCMPARLAVIITE